MSERKNPSPYAPLSESKHILVLGDKNYSIKNVRETKPFTAPTLYITRTLAKEAGIPSDMIEFYNLFESDYFMERKFHGPFPTRYEFSELFFKKEKELKEYILKTRPSVVVTTHELPFFLLTEEWNIDKFRGTLLNSTLIKGLKVIPTFHPLRINKQYIMKVPCLMDFRKAKKLLRTQGFPKDERVLITNPPFKDFMAFCDKLVKDDAITEIAFDIETVQPGTHISWMGLSASRDFAMSFKLIHSRMPTITLDNEFLFWNKMYEVFNCGKELIAHNGVYDCSVIQLNHGFFPKLTFDTMLAAHSIWPQLQRSLGFVASMLLDVQAWKHTSKEDMGLYNAMDVANTHGIYKEIGPLLDEYGVRDIFNFEMSQCEVVSFLGLNGITVDMKEKLSMEEDYESKLAVIESLLITIMEKRYNWASTKQMCEILYDIFALPRQYNIIKSGKNKGKRSLTSDNKALKKLLLKASGEKEKAFLEALLKHRTIYQMLTTFLGFETEPVTNKVFTSYNIAGTKEGRYSASTSIIKPFGTGNLQNQPKEVRRLYIPNA